MELTPGFKLSEAGPIPEDWEVVRLGDSRPFVTSGSRGWSRYYAPTGDLFVRITNMFRDEVRLDLSDARFVQPPPQNSEVERTALQRNDLLISITADIGIVSLVTKDVPLPAFVNQHIAAVRLGRNTISPLYAAYALKSGHSAAWFRAITDAGAKAGINLLTVRETPIVAPPLPEQQAIAEVLEDIDAWITAAAAEAAKLTAVKAAAMGALLTPTTRLPGFEGKWVPRRIGELYDFGKTVPISRAAYDGEADVGCVHYGDIHVLWDGHLDLRTMRVPKVSRHLLARATRLISGDVLVADAAEDIEGVGKAVEIVGLHDDEVVGGLHIQALRQTGDQVAVGFAGYLFKQDGYRRAVERAASGLKVFGISKSQLEGLEVLLPPTLAEQRAIAAVLTDIDAALSATRAVVAKTKGVKAAAMDALLSGRIRLPLP